MCGKKAISLLSGAGGLDIGFEKAGFQIVLSNEFDHDAACTWRANRAENCNAMREGDIAEILPELARYRGTVDVLFGGPPCQGFSVAGKMDPNDSRSKLKLKSIRVEKSRQKYKAEHDDELRTFYMAERKLKSYFKDGKLPITAWRREREKLEQEYIRICESQL